MVRVATRLAANPGNSGPRDTRCRLINQLMTFFLDFLKIPHSIWIATAARRAILAAQSNHFRLLIARDPESLPLLCPLPQLHPQAVKLLLRFFYSGLVGVVDCGGDPMLVVECLRATDAFLQGAPQDRPKLDALKLHLESQLTSSLDSEAAGKAIAMLNTTGLKDTLDRCMPLFMAHARRNGGSVLQGLLEGVDLDTFVAAVKGSEFPGGEIQKFRFIRAWAEGNHAGEKERVVLDSLIDLEGIGLDDMEREVEVRFGMPNEAKAPLQEHLVLAPLSCPHLMSRAHSGVVISALTSPLE